tara:strand:- start:49 stop:204 length:156 start_codon:yes stop_codon:yes gene_type:complete
MKKNTDSIEEMSIALRLLMPSNSQPKRLFEMSNIIDKVIKNNKILNKLFEW